MWLLRSWAKGLKHSSQGEAKFPIFEQNEIGSLFKLTFDA